MTRFLDRQVVITGASSGIGATLARDLAQEGARVWLLGRDKVRLAKIAAECGPKSRFFSVELADIAAINQFLAQNPLTHLDILIHAAGSCRLQPLADAPIADLEQTWSLNLRAPVVLTQAWLEPLAQSRGQVVLINSGMGLATRPSWGYYAMTKHALKAYADTLREELKPRGIRVLSVYPGRTATPMQAEVRAQEGAAYHPEDFIQPQDVSQMVRMALALPPSAAVVDLNIRPGK